MASIELFQITFCINNY